MKSIPRFFRSLFKNSSFRQLLVFKRAVTASWHVYIEKPVSVEELNYSREAASIPSFGFFFLLVSATIIATLGLLSDSAAVIIGAMIVAPLMNPILSMSFAIVTANWKLYQRSILTVSLGTCSVILFSYGISHLLPFNIIGSEILARTSPNLFDLGIAIAAGAAGAFSLTRQSIASSIAGVAIAVALVPPLCVVGIGLGIGNEFAADFGQIAVSDLNISNVSAKAFLLFLVNLTGITFTACIVFLSQSYGNLYKAFQTLVIWFLVMALLCSPLNNSLQEFLVASRVNMEIRKLRREYPEIARQSSINNVSVQLEGTTAYITITTTAPEGLFSDEYLKAGKKRIGDSVSAMGVKSIDAVFKVIPVNIQEYQLISK